MTVKALLAGRLSEEDEYLIAKGVSTGYQACHRFMQECMALGSFYPGMTHRGYLLGIFAQFGLDQVAAQSQKFFSSVKPNQIRNHFHSHFEFPSRLHLTAIYTGKKADRRGRKAVYRGLLAQANGPGLFSELENQAPAPSDLNDPIYAQILHGGWEKPIAIVLAIPNPDQRTYSLLPHALPLITPDAAAAEQVSETIKFAIRSSDDEQRDTKETG